MARMACLERGQVDSIAKALEQELECSVIFDTIAAFRGFFDDSLMAEISESDIRFYVVNRDLDPAHNNPRPRRN